MLYSKDIYRYAFSLLKNEDDAKDAVQEAFLKYNLNEVQFRKEASPKTLLLVITRNYCFSKLKLVERKNTYIEDEDDFSDQFSGFDTALTISEALKMLKPEQIELLFLKVNANYSYAEIAELTNQTVQNVAVKLCRIRKLLQRIIKEY